MPTRGHAACILASLILGACGGATSSGDLFGGDASAPGSDGGGGDAGAVEGGATFDAASFCSQLEAWSQRCGASFSAKDCATDHQCFAALARPDALTTYESCLVTRDCATNRDTCAARAASPYTTDPSFTKYQQACTTRMQQCQQAGQTFPDDACKGPYAMLRPAFLDDIAACFANPCNTIGSCIETKQIAVGCR
jgi:hypothetical protein